MGPLEVSVILQLIDRWCNRRRLDCFDLVSLHVRDTDGSGFARSLYFLEALPGGLHLLSGRDDEWIVE